jgi:hypothetical protein
VLADPSLTLNRTVTVQQTASKVTVEAAPIQVDTKTSTLNHVVEQKRTVDLPLNGRKCQTSFKMDVSSNTYTNVNQPFPFPMLSKSSAFRPVITRQDTGECGVVNIMTRLT